MPGVPECGSPCRGKAFEYKGFSPPTANAAQFPERAAPKKSPNTGFGLNPPKEEGGGDNLNCPEAVAMKEL
jgi:hypothetical protein